MSQKLLQKLKLSSLGFELVDFQYFKILRILEKDKKLPAIFFSYDREFTEQLTAEALENFVSLDERLDIPQHRTTAYNIFRRPPRMAAGIADFERLEFVDKKYVTDRLRGYEDDDLFKLAIRRGVSYHHSGMDFAKRVTVEMLFREKFLNVVNATGTLALGIHMPCKTVVLAGDSIYLNALEFRQICGRAGRRGHDLIGKVIFVGFPHQKIQRLVTGHLPKLTGNFLLNVTLMLRLLLLQNQTRQEYKERTMLRSLALLENSLISFSNPSIKNQVKHHALFSVQFLLRQGLLNISGIPQGLAGMATHLHYYEPSNFVLIKFIESGLLHKLCQFHKKSSIHFSSELMEELVLIFSHLFARHQVHAHMYNRPHSFSFVKLPPLPEPFREVVDNYNDEVSSVFDLYLRTVGEYIAEKHGSDVILPLSQVEAVRTTDLNIPENSLECHLKMSSRPVRVCSSFVALSGCQDEGLYTTEELISIVRQDVYTDAKLIPTLDLRKSLNAYAFDFFRHGSKELLEKENGIPLSSIYNMLRDFLLVLRVIHTSVSLQAETDDMFVRAMKQLVDRYDEKFNQSFPSDHRSENCREYYNRIYDQSKTTSSVLMEEIQEFCNQFAQSCLKGALQKLDKYYRQEICHPSNVKQNLAENVFYVDVPLQNFGKENSYSENLDQNIALFCHCEETEQLRLGVAGNRQDVKHKIEENLSVPEVSVPSKQNTKCERRVEPQGAKKSEKKRKKGKKTLSVPQQTGAKNSKKRKKKEKKSLSVPQHQKMTKMEEVSEGYVETKAEERTSSVISAVKGIREAAFLQQSETVSNQKTKKEKHPASLIRKRTANLMNYFSECEVFLIDGDSMLLEIFGHHTLDWSHGGQILHFIYLVEKYLQIFTLKGGIFHVMFFKDWDIIWSSYPMILLLRHVLQIHLKTNTNIPVENRFGSLYDRDFLKFVRELKPTFLLLLPNTTNLKNVLNYLPKRLDDFCLSQILRSLTIGLNCAFTSNITVKVNSLEGVYCDAQAQFCIYKIKLTSWKKLIPPIRNPKFNIANFPDQNSMQGSHQDVRLLINTFAAMNYLYNMEYSSAVDLSLVQIFLLHTALLVHFPLKFRAQKTVLNASCVISDFMYKIQENMSEFLPTVDNLNCNSSMICDIFDGRLFYVLVELAVKDDGITSCSLTPEVADTYSTYWKMLTESLKLFGEPFPLSMQKNEVYKKSSKFKHGAPCPPINTTSDFLVAVSCPLLEDYAKDVLQHPRVAKMISSEPWIADNVTSGKNFDERYHWHSGKSLTNKFYNAHDESIMCYRNHKQHYPFVFKKYAASLREEKKHKNLERPWRKKESEISKELKELKNLLAECKYNEVVIMVEHQLTFFTTPSDDQLDLQLVHLEACAYYFKQLNVQTKFDMQTQLLVVEVRRSFLATLQNIFDDHYNWLSDKEIALVSDLVAMCGFYDILRKKNLLPRTMNKSLPSSSIEFQLEHCGPYLKQEVLTDRDPRIKNFIPDTWQREMFDAVDKRQSMLIVAPTSSGKTYASYYAMEQVLNSGKDGIVVYVSPTKALVNQVAASLYAKFANRKEFRNRRGKTNTPVLGVFTRDFKLHTDFCRILITVPQCLEILLLSPARQEWAMKIKYVIFDEVHCLMTEIGAEVWERLILLINCPLIALSATIENPKELHTWLQLVEKSKYTYDYRKKKQRRRRNLAYEVQLIICEERHSDLESYIYVPDHSDCDSLLCMDNLHPIHPIGLMTLRRLQFYSKGTFPTHIALTPQQTLVLHEALCKVWPENTDVFNLSPDVYFSNVIFLTRTHVRKYEQALKELLLKWVRMEEYSKLQRVIDTFNISDFSQKRGTAGDVFVKRHYFNLLKILEQQSNLPAIFFLYNRVFIESLTKHAVEKFQDEMKTKEGKKEENKNGDNKESRTKKKALTIDELFAKDRTMNHGDGDFTQIGQLKDVQLLLDHISDLEHTEVFREGLQYGIGYHHSGMVNRMRVSVEMLFRKKFLNAVNATSTLAYGIHMPCKTVVLADDSVYLNTIQFRQMCGRAGRRGFDLTGKVVFLGFPFDRIQRLMTGQLPRLTGNFPLNVTLVLRMLLLVTQTRGEYKDRALHSCHTFLTNSLLTFCNQNPKKGVEQFNKDSTQKSYSIPDLESQIKHHFLFSVQFLIRDGLLDTSGIPQGLAGLATHLHYHEPANFVLIKFIKSGRLHELCEKHKNCEHKKEEDSEGFQFCPFLMKQLVVILSHLFARLPLRAQSFKEDMLPNVRLPPLQNKFKKIIKEHNEKVSSVFDLYLRTVAHYISDRNGPDHFLPFSKLHVGPADHLKIPENTLEYQLKAMSSPVQVCSSFIALSGYQDESLYTTDELISVIRHDVYTDSSLIPTLEVNGEYNGYAYNFFVHGSAEKIRQENEIMAGDIYCHLQDFTLVLKSIYISVRELADSQDDLFLKAMKQLAELYAKKFRKEFPGWREF